MKKLLLLPGLLLGIALFWYMSQNKPGPEKTQILERAKPVRIIPAPQVILIPIAVGNGYVQPERTWKAVAEVAGRIVDFNPDLQQGNQFKPGQSGNPQGRPSGSRHKATLAAQALLDGEAEA